MSSAISLQPQAHTAQHEAHGGTACAHCGDACQDRGIALDDKAFCCEGCKTVYEILHVNNLEDFYRINERAGVAQRGAKAQNQYAYLDDAEVASKLVQYADEALVKVSFHIPQVHCASCIWLLENLYKLDSGIAQSQVNFMKKELSLGFRPQETSLRRIAEMLDSIGYAPAINMQHLDAPKKQVASRSFYYKFGVAGFCFGNIMLLSFPEYLGMTHGQDAFFVQLFGYLNIILSLPLVFYSGNDYVRSAYFGLKAGNMNIDVPIAIGIFTLFLRSSYEIVTHTGAGYLDSLAGLIFFLLAGKWFQQKTYHTLSFERDYKSYFPIAATVIGPDGQQQTLAVNKLQEGQSILVHHGELVPADGVLMEGEGQIDYSFVTGESVPQQRSKGDKLYAGGRQMGGNIVVALTKRVSQSYLTQLWNDDAFQREDKTEAVRLADRVGRVFTSIILGIAVLTLAYWLPRDLPRAINAFTAVLIIACPCAVALAIPFTFGNVLRVLGRHGFYLKNTNVIEDIKSVNHIVFDKTGTITDQKHVDILYTGKALDGAERSALFSLVQQSNHPSSRRIAEQLAGTPVAKVLDFQEHIGAGLSGTVAGRRLRIGSAQFLGREDTGSSKGVHIAIDGEYKGAYMFRYGYRKGLAEVLASLRRRAWISLLSGDNDAEKHRLSFIFPQMSRLLFEQKPKDKLDYIKDLQSQGQRVMMVGDGLNDAGALQQSQVGIVIAEDVNNFTPACDAIIAAPRFAELPRFIRYVEGSVHLLFGAYGLALIYNIIGLSYAVQGTLSPIVAAILMPLSSITIVLYGILSTNLLAQRHQLRQPKAEEIEVVF